MSEFYGHFLGALTVLIMLSFIGIWVWAWLPQHKRDFDALAELPMEDDICLKRAEIATAAVASAMGWRGADALQSGGADLSPELAELASRPGLFERQEDAR